MCVAVVLLVTASSRVNASVADAELRPAPTTTVVAANETVDAVRAFLEHTPAQPRKADTADAPKKSDSGGKVIYLTFDDGPTVKYTKPILDVLDQYDAKATFFQLGEKATAHPELTRLVVARGHALGSHTWNHKDLRKLSRANWTARSLGHRMRWARSPAARSPASALRTERRTARSSPPFTARA